MEKNTFLSEASDSTGGNLTERVTLFEDVKTIVYPFDKYEITVKVSAANEFIGITEVKLNKQFLNFQQKMSASTARDVEEYYQD